MAPIDVHFDVPNYEKISSFYLTPDFDFEDITVILRTINDSNLVHERLVFSLDQSTAETSANPDYVLDTASSDSKIVVSSFDTQVKLQLLLLYGVQILIKQTK